VGVFSSASKKATDLGHLAMLKKLLEVESGASDVRIDEERRLVKACHEHTAHVLVADSLHHVSIF